MSRGDVEGFLARLHDATKPPMIMGVLNLTPDSFSDGGRLLDPARPADVGRALAEARRMVAEGAEILDLGAESSRPGSLPVDADEELRRLTPLLRRLADEGLTWLSVDTQRAEVARAAVEAGVVLINDISAGRRDPELWPLVADLGLPCVIMHMRGTPETMQAAPHYEQVLAEVSGFLRERSAALAELGLPRERMVMDPGIGFGKRQVDNQQLLAGLASLCGHPLLLGVSRKSFIGVVEEAAGRLASSPNERLGGSVAAALWGMRAGVRVLRVHDVAATRQALQVWRWMEEGTS